MYLFSVDADIVVELAQSSVWPFGPFAVLFLFGVFDEVFGVFVDTEISEVHVSFFDVFDFGVVLVGGEPGQAFPEHVDSQGVVAGDQHVDPEIVFEPIDEMGVVDVLRDEGVFFVFDFGLLVDHFDTPSAGLVGGFHDPESRFLGVFPDHFEPVKVGRKQVCDGNKVIILRKGPALFIQMFPHVIFASQVPAPRKMVNFLKPFHGLNRFQMRAIDIEKDVPIVSRLHPREPIIL